MKPAPAVEHTDDRDLAREREAPAQSAEELIMHLERDQFVVATSQPVPLAKLGARVRALLWTLRIFVVLVGIMVLYTFVDRLH
jgi:hypothetical protein